MAEGVDGGSHTEDGYRNDLWGYPVHTQSDACISFINEFYHQVLMYGAEREVILKATDADGSCVLACALAAVHLLSQNRPDSESNYFLAVANKNLDKATNYERSVLATAMACVKGETGVALDLHFQLLEQFPKDLSSLKRGQTLCFYTGRSHDMLRMAELVLPANLESPYMYGMLAFPLIEVGERMREAEVAAKKGLSIEPNDVWSQHALGHVLQYECRFKDALIFAASCCDTWTSCCSFMYIHNWWHLALCKLELGGEGALESVVTIYDTHIWSSNAAASNSQDCSNSLGLLLRLDVRGHNDIVTAKISDMQTCLLDEQRWCTEWLQDILIVWGLARGVHKEAARKLLQNLKLRVKNMEGEQQKPLLPVISLAEALYEYGVGNFRAVSELLGLDSDLFKYKAMGASNEQLDVFQELWCDAFIRAGNPLPVVEVAERRVLERSGIPFSWRVLVKAYSAIGENVKANNARSMVQKLEEGILDIVME